jgi:endonuclease/exonuclease/phosphatase family metal-dependent hydrolase
MSFVVATWNVQWQFGEWESRQPAIESTLASLDADVVMLQESWRGQVDRLAKQLGYESVWAGHDSRDNPERSMGNAILSRWPIETTAHRFLDDAQGRQYRTIVCARINTPHGIVPAFTTHLEHRYDQSATRMQQLQLASEFIEEHATGGLPPVLTGDLNAVHDSDEIRKLTGRSAPYVSGRIWTDSWEQVGAGAGLTWSNQNPYLANSAWPNRRLDYVMIGWPRDGRPIGNPVRAWLVGTEPIDGISGSDHYGVAVEIHT